MISISKVQIDQHTKETVLKILDSGQLASGKYVKEFEHNFAQTCQLKYAVAVTSGTSALHTALTILDIGYGDEVITTPFTYVATANAIALTGATPIFVDIDPVTFNLDPRKIAAAVTPQTKAILAVDLYGLPANYQALRVIANQYKLKIIEDAAQAIGATFKGKPTGSLADISCFSLYATKNLMTGEGGMITTNSKRLETKARRYINHGESTGHNYSYQGLGQNYNPNEIMAAIGLGQLQDFHQRTQRRQEIARIYQYKLSVLKGLILPSIPKNHTHVFHQYTLRVTNNFPLTRDQLQQALASKGITSRIYYPKPLHRFPHLNPKNRQYHLPQATKASRQVLSIPIHPYLTDTEVTHILNSIKQIAAKEAK